MKIAEPNAITSAAKDATILGIGIPDQQVFLPGFGEEPTSQSQKPLVLQHDALRSLRLGVVTDPQSESSKS